MRRKRTINCNYLNDILQDETGILFSKFGDNPKKFLVAWVNSCHFPCTFVDVGVCDNGRPTDTRYYRQDGFVMCRPWQCELGLTSTQTNSARQTSNRLLPLFSQLFVSTKSGPFARMLHCTLNTKEAEVVRWKKRAKFSPAVHQSQSSYSSDLSCFYTSHDDA